MMTAKTGKNVSGAVSVSDLDLQREIRDREDLRAARLGAADVRKNGAIPWSKVKRDLARR
jgi:hypothetical protein